MNYRLVALDLDGTLMDKNYHISDENLWAIRSVLRKGLRVIACSGRVLQETAEIARFAGLDDVCIAANGAVIQNAQKDVILFEDHIPQPCGIELISILQKIKGACFLVYAGQRPTCGLDMFAQLKDTLIGSGYISGLRRRINIVLDVRSYIVKRDLHIHKVLVLAQDEQVLQKVREDLEGIDCINITSSDRYNLEIMHKGVNKANALGIYCRHLGVDKSEVITIGDSFNDVEMLRCAGLGIAMGNAPEQVKAAADYVTQTIDANGVARALDMFVLSVS